MACKLREKKKNYSMGKARIYAIGEIENLDNIPWADTLKIR